MKRSRFIQRYDGEGWAQKDGEPFDVACCDCGLVHTFVIVVGKEEDKGLIGIATRRENRSTGQRRRWKKIKIVKS